MKLMKKSNNNQKTVYIIIGILTIIALVVLVALLVITNNNTNMAQPTGDSCVSDECLGVDGLEYPVENSSPEVDIKSLLSRAIDDEYKARATYNAVVIKLGSVRPFVMIRSAEESHIASLKALFDKYGFAIPTDPYIDLTALPTLSENCKVGVDAEIANINLYKDELLPNVVNYPDITQVFNNLMPASRDKHLPAFEKCS